MNDRSFTAHLVTTAPVHLGGGEDGIAADLPLLRDPGGGFYVPGTQVAGRLREIATRLAPTLGWDPCVTLDAGRAPMDRGACGCRVCRLFGSRFHGNAGDDEPGGSASLAWCFDALLEGGGPPRSLVRDGVGIDRRSGTASHEARALYDAEWIPAGARFALHLELDRRASAEDEATLALALSEWAAGRGRIGGGAARGGGAFELHDPEFRRAQLNSDDDLLAFLGAAASSRGAPEEGWLQAREETLRTAVGSADDELPAGAVGWFAELSFDLAFQGALLVNDPGAALVHALNFAPVFTGPDWRTPVLPGSSLRGVLRAQVERIARTVGTRAAADLRAFAASCPACDPFRASPETGPREALASCAELRKELEQAPGAAPPDYPDDCLGCSLFGSTHVGSRLWIADAPLQGEGRYRLRDFVAIDRFTGGAKHGAKFDALPLYDPVFRPALLLWNPRPWELAALAFALRDLHDGLMTVGAHGSKGFGRAEVRGVTLRLGSIGGRGPALVADAQKPSGVFQVRVWTGDDAAALVALARAGEPSWASDFVEACGRADRRDVPDGAKLVDAWFGAPGAGGLALADLYPAGPASLAAE